MPGDAVVISQPTSDAVDNLPMQLISGTDCKYKYSVSHSRLIKETRTLKD